MRERKALQLIEQQYKELNEDLVAKKEFATRLSSIRPKELSIINKVIARPQESKWFVDGKEARVKNSRHFQALLHHILIQTYPSSPEIHNELINRMRPSAQAVAASKRLMLAMLSQGRRQGLGIEKFPPEKSIYRALLKDIHKAKRGQGFYFYPPSPQSSLSKVWKRMEDFLADTEKGAQPFTAINAEMLAPPYGVKAGILPILWLAIYLANEHELALFEDNNYAPKFTEEMLDRFLKRPDKFSVQRFRVEGLRASLFNQYCNVIDIGPTPQSVIDIARPLAHFIGNLPEYTLRTRQGLSPEAIAVRDAFIRTKTPELFIFDTLPKALGYEKGPASFTNGGRVFSESLKDVLRELKNAHTKLVLEMRTHFARSLGLSASMSLSELRAASLQRCAGLENYVVDNGEQAGMFGRINRRIGDDERWFDAILLFLANKPSKKWLDKDKAKARYNLANFAYSLTDLLKIVGSEKEMVQRLSDDTTTTYLLRSLKKGGSFMEEVIRIEEKQQKKISGIKDEIYKTLRSNKDDNLQLAALAELVNEFLRDYKDSQKKDTEYDLFTEKVKTIS